MSNFLNFDIAAINTELVRNYLIFNKKGKITSFYTFLLCCLRPVQQYFDNFVIFRNKKFDIANCDWTFGNVTNLLNSFFDSTQKRIYLTQSRATFIFAPDISFESDVFVPDINSESNVFAPDINFKFGVLALVIVWLPSNLYNNAITKAEIINTIEQIKLYNIDYQINEIL